MESSDGIAHAPRRLKKKAQKPIAAALRFRTNAVKQRITTEHTTHASSDPQVRGLDNRGGTSGRLTPTADLGTGALLVVLFVAGCSSASSTTSSPFDGTWVGSVTYSAVTCSDGTTTSKAVDDVGIIIGGGTWHSSCGDVILSLPNPATAIQTKPATCAPKTTANAQVTATRHDAKFILSGSSALLVDFIEDKAIAFNDGKTASCNGSHAMGEVFAQ